jgi:hypothetical protein
MSFASFGPLPKPQPNPIPASPSNPLSNPVGEGRGEASALWQAVARLLAGIDPDVRGYVQQVFLTTLEAAEADLALPPERRRLVPRPVAEQQQRCASGKASAALDGHSQREVDDLLRQALWRAVDALEAAALLPERMICLSILAEQCRQLERVYQHLKQRAGGRLEALWIAQGELKLLRHRGSRVIEQLLLGETRPA